jgi:hypothetical protein
MSASGSGSVVYRIVEHDGGWAYKVGNVFSETFRDHASAKAAAERAAREQRISGQTTEIQFEDASGRWHLENSPGDDRPQTRVVDEP